MAREHQNTRPPAPQDKPDNRELRSQEGRGRNARYPWQIPLKGWKDILLRVREESGRDNLAIVSAGVAFYAFLSLFPMLLAVFSIYGLFSDPNDVAAQVSRVSTVMPEPAQELLNAQLTRLLSQSGGALGWGTLIGLVGALWGSARAIKAMMAGLNVVYEEHDERGFIKVNLIGLLLTGSLLLSVVVALLGIVGVPIVLATVGLDGLWQSFLNIARWPLLALIAGTVLSVLYRWGPDREDAKWRWVTPGAFLATVCWLLASWLFSIFVSHFGNYANTYGSIAAIVVLMFWLSISAQIALLGAEVDAEMEHQTAEDSTTNPEEAMGDRGAQMADTLGKSHGKDGEAKGEDTGPDPGKKA